MMLLFAGTICLPAHVQAAAQTDAGADPVPDVDTLAQWKQCREYLTPVEKKDRGCRIDFDMTQTSDGVLPAQTHRDVNIPLGTTMRGVVVLWRSSPFAACSLTTSPGPLARDLSQNAGSSLTALAGFGGSLGITVEITASLAAKQAEGANAIVEDRLTFAPLPQKVLDEEKAITEALNKFTDDARPYDHLKPALEEAGVIKKTLLYSYATAKEARAAVSTIEQSATRIVSATFPDEKTMPTLQADRGVLQEKIAALEKEHSADQSVQTFLDTAKRQLAAADSLIDKNGRDNVTALAAYTKDVQSKTQKLLDFVEDWKTKDQARLTLGLKPDPSVQALPIALYPESKVGITVKCADAVTGAALPDSIQFNAYFQKPPVFDLSSGVLVSLLPGRQAAVQTPYSDPTAASSCTVGSTNTSGCPIVVIRKARPQFMPGVFAEWHPGWLNFKLPWVRDAAIPGPMSIPGCRQTRRDMRSDMWVRSGWRGDS